MPLNFPSNPVTFQTTIQGGKTWTYDGVHWQPGGTSGYQGSLGYQGSTGTGVTSNTSSLIIFAAGNTTVSPITLTSGNTLSTANAGVLEYNGTDLYFTPSGQQRGVIAAEQYYIVQNTTSQANTTGATTLGLFANVGVTLSSQTVYKFDGQFALVKFVGTTSHTVATTFGGTANNYNILYNVAEGDAGGTVGTLATATRLISANTTANVVITGALTGAQQVVNITMNGTISVNSGGTFIPRFALSAAPGGAYFVVAGSYFKISPVGTYSGANIVIGTWA